MTLFSKLFRSRGKNNTLVFVDYEYWFYSYQTLYDMRPSPVLWRKEIEKNHNISDIMVFGDFSHDAINQELCKIREITNTIIETQNTDARRKKDMTDFIMLDYIYQTAAERPEIETYILFTGDGHFHSVAKYLIQKLRKRVIVYGVSGSISKSLKSAASEVRELPSSEEQNMRYYNMILQNFAYIENRSDIFPTIKTTVSTVARVNDVSEAEVLSALKQLMEYGYIYQRETRVRSNNRVKIVVADWKALKRDGIWTQEIPGRQK